MRQSFVKLHPRMPLGNLLNLMHFWKPPSKYPPCCPGKTSLKISTLLPRGNLSNKQEVHWETLVINVIASFFSFICLLFFICIASFLNIFFNFYLHRQFSTLEKYLSCCFDSLNTINEYDLILVIANWVWYLIWLIGLRKTDKASLLSRGGLLVSALMNNSIQQKFHHNYSLIKKFHHKYSLINNYPQIAFRSGLSVFASQTVQASTRIPKSRSPILDWLKLEISILFKTSTTTFINGFIQMVIAALPLQRKNVFFQAHKNSKIRF